MLSMWPFPHRPCSVHGADGNGLSGSARCPAVHVVRSVQGMHGKLAFWSMAEVRLGCCRAQVDIVPREERCDDGPRPMPAQQAAGVAVPGMPGMPGGAPLGYWQPPPQQGGPAQQMGQVGGGAPGGPPGGDLQQQQQQQHMGMAGVGQPQGAMNPSMIQASCPAHLCAYGLIKPYGSLSARLPRCKGGFAHTYGMSMADSVPACVPCRPTTASRMHSSRRQCSSSSSKRSSSMQPSSSSKRSR